MAKLTCVQIDGQEHLVDVAPAPRSMLHPIATAQESISAKA